MRRAFGPAALLLLLTLPAGAQCPGDLNGNTELEIADVIRLVGKILDGETCASPAPTRTRTPDPRTPTPTIPEFTPDRFVDAGNGTVRAEVRHLAWEKKARAGGDHDVDATFTFAEVGGLIARLNAARFGGRSNWRLPDRAELYSLIHVTVEEDPLPPFPPFDTDCRAGCTVLSCSCTADDWYWSSEPANPRGEQRAYPGIGRYNGQSFPPETALRVRLVAPLP